MPWKHKKKLNDFMTAVADDSEGEIWIYGDIVDDAWWDDEVSPVIVRDALNNMGPVSTLNIRVNSYGGSVYAGNAIINILDNYRNKTGCKIHAYIEGIAASMSSGVPMVADKIYMAENAMLMVHKPWSVAMGNYDDMQKTVTELQKAEDTLVVNYMRKFNGTEDELRQLLADETWLTAEEALEWGLCDVIIPSVPVAASAKGIRINNSEFIRDASKIAARFTPNTPLASTNIAYRNTKNGGNENVYEYDEQLKSYGIDKQSFNKLNVSAGSALSIAKSVENALQELDKTFYIAWPKSYVKHEFGTDAVSGDDILAWAKKGMEIDKETDSVVIPMKAVTDAMGDEMNAVDLLRYAYAGLNVDESTAAKAKAYDKMVENAIDETIKMGIKAKGDGFKEDKWRKILSSLDYDEIIDQKSEWEEEAKIVLNAGKRVSQPWQQVPDSYTSVNADNYNFCK